MILDYFEKRKVRLALPNQEEAKAAVDEYVLKRFLFVDK